MLQTTPQQKAQKRNSQTWTFRNIPFSCSDSIWKSCLPPPPQEDLTPYEYFKHYITDEVIDLIVEQSNIYAHQKDGKVLNVSRTEIEQFLSILLQMGIVHMPSVRLYWSSECRYSPIADLMSRNRFQQILQYFHLVDNEKSVPLTDPTYDKLFKVRPVLTTLQTAMHNIPQEEKQSVDEQIIPFKGRSGIKQYIKNKPHKWGYKCFTRAGSSGLLYDFKIYTGKNTASDYGIGFSGNIVLTLADNIPVDKNYKLYADNFFSSLMLVKHLKERGIFYLGTVRKDRMGKCPLSSEEELRNKDRGSYDHRVETNDNVALVRWLDKKGVNFISSYACIEPVDSCKRWSKQERKFVQVPRPFVVQEYNKFMGGVDLSDMLLELYRINIRSNKWYMRIIFWCLGVSVVNSWLLYRRHEIQKNVKPQLALIQFQSKIATALAMAGKLVSRKRGRPSSSTDTSPLQTQKKRNTSFAAIDDVRFDNVCHFPTVIEVQGRCKNCVKGYTKIACIKCSVRLCLTAERNCFLQYHSK